MTHPGVSCKETEKTHIRGRWQVGRLNELGHRPPYIKPVALALALALAFELGCGTCWEK